MANENKTCSLKSSFYSRPLINTVINISLYMLGAASTTAYVNNQWERTLVDKGYAEYNNKTKEWYLCSADQIVLNTNDKTVIGDVPFGITTASTYIKFLLNELKDRKQTVEVLEKQLVEKEMIIEKARKK